MSKAAEGAAVDSSKDDSLAPDEAKKPRAKKTKKPKLQPDCSRGALPIELGFIARLVLTTGGAVLMFTALPTWDYWWNSFFGMVPILIAIHDRTPKAAFLWGAWAGWVANTGGFYWISGLLMDFAHLPAWISWSACLFLTLLQGLEFALWAWIIRKVQVSRFEWPLWAIAIPVWLGIELWFPMLFKWYLGNLNYRFIPGIQIAEIFGVHGVSAAILLVNMLVYSAVAWLLAKRKNPEAPFPRRFMAIGAGIYAACIVFGLVRIAQIDAAMEEADKLRIGLVEGNIGIGEKEDPEKLDNNILIHQNLSASLGDVDLVVWPETSYQSTHIWGSVEPTDDVLFLELDSLFVPKFRDGILPAARALEVGFGRRLDHTPEMHRIFHVAAARAAMARGYAEVGYIDLMGGIRFGSKRPRRTPYPYRCGERARMHLKCPFLWVPPDDVTFLLPGREPLQPDTRADEAAGTFVWNQRAVKRGFDAPLLYGALTIRARSGDQKDYRKVLRGRRDERDLYNVALTLDEHGRVISNYKKVFLLLFGEYIPGGDTFPQIYDWIPEAGSFTAGEQPQTFMLDGHRIGLMICYEDIIPTFSRSLAHLEPEVVINVTNDAWFGKTSEPFQHLALSAMRSVETRTWLIRSTNTGVSVFFDANGRIISETSLEDAEVLVEDVPMMTGGKTIYTHIGDLIAWVALAITLSLLLFAWRPWQLGDDDDADEEAEVVAA